MRFSGQLVYLLLPSLVAARRPTAQQFTLPLPLINGSTPITETVGFVPLDGVYITQPNATSYEWWYFDVVSESHDFSVVFVTSVSYSATTGAPELLADLTISYPNGTWTQITIPQDKLNFSTVGQGSFAVAEAFSWCSARDLSAYTISLDLEEQGVTGEIHMSSIAPPHVKCGPAVKGASLTDAEHILWINLVPDAVASVDINVNGTSVSFNGSGYHDKNWGSNSYADVLDQWYWGHGRSGAYSIVFFWIIQENGEIVASAYVTKHDKIIYSTCDPGSVVIRPFNTEGIVYPVPFNGSASLEGLYINIDAGNDTGKFAFTAQRSNVIQTDGDPSTYRRWIGSLTGGAEANGENSTGFALWEQMGPFS